MQRLFWQFPSKMIILSSQELQYMLMEDIGLISYSWSFLKALLFPEGLGKNHNASHSIFANAFLKNASVSSRIWKQALQTISKKMFCKQFLRSYYNSEHQNHLENFYDTYVLCIPIVREVILIIITEIKDSNRCVFYSLKFTLWFFI